jgi:hypothetical protein
LSFSLTVAEYFPFLSLQTPSKPEVVLDDSNAYQGGPGAVSSAAREHFPRDHRYLGFRCTAAGSGLKR